MSKKLKLSPWHDGSVKPVHVGVYERDGREYGFSFWDGKEWGYFSPSVHLCLRFKSEDQNAKWRGILK